jgi:hypothetical protein
MSAPGRQAVLPAHLRADCAACTGLCCVVPPFDALQGFGFDKPAHTPCPHLRDDHRCGIHEHLDARGFRGCTVFDCHGAGQRVSQQLFPGQDWRDSAETAQRMFSAYEQMRGLHDLMALLYTASVHVADARLTAQLDAIERVCENAALDPIEVGELKRSTMALLADPAIRAGLEGLRQAQPERGGSA